jgi:hypothetical protein
MQVVFVAIVGIAIRRWISLIQAKDQADHGR